MAPPDEAHNPNIPALDINQVSVAYNSGGRQLSSALHALENISCRIDVGEQIAVIGPNGAGKSTLFKLLAGMLNPDSGQVRMFGNPPKSHDCIAYVGQRSEIDWTFPVTVSDVVMMGRLRHIGLFRRPGKRDHEMVAASLERVQMLPLAHKQIGELSGGQQQRVFVARALAQETNLLLMDEPLSGLDIPGQEAIFEILAGLRPDKVTVLVATHDLTLAANRFDRVLLLNRQMVAFGAPTAVLTPENLLAAFGGHLPIIEEMNGLAA